MLSLRVSTVFVYDLPVPAVNEKEDKKWNGLQKA